MIVFFSTFAVFALSFAALGVGALWLRPLTKKGCAPSDCVTCERRKD